jgi:FtsH-binding integral membrane protein
MTKLTAWLASVILLALCLGIAMALGSWLAVIIFCALLAWVLRMAAEALA